VQTLESADEPKLLIPSPQTIDDLTNFSDPQIDADDYLAYLQVPNYFDISVDPLDSGLLSILLRRIYLTFADDFDFVFVISNNTERPEGAAFGRFYNVKNEVAGIGLGIFDSTASYGSEGQLQGIMHFPYRTGLWNGPGLHELAHNWGNYVCSTSARSHWGHTGFGGGKGQLGGYDLSTLEDLGGGNYRAQSFGTIANGGNSLPYNDVELYLMGLVDAVEVADIAPATNAVSTERDSNYQNFTADSVDRQTFTQFLASKEIPTRSPAASVGQDFRVLTVLISNDEITEAEMLQASDQIQRISAQGDDGSRLYNFNEATGYRATLTAGNLSTSLR
jgi:hypothetical protein